MCVCIFFFYSTRSFLCRREWENGYDNSSNSRVFSTCRPRQLWWWVIWMWRRNVMFVLEMLLCGTMNYGCLCLSVLPVSWMRANQWNTSVKCSDKCTHLCFYYVTQWIMQNWSSAIHSYYSIIIHYTANIFTLTWHLSCFIYNGSWSRYSTPPQTNSNRHIHYYWMNELQNKSWTQLQIHLILFFSVHIGVSSSHV